MGAGHSKAYLEDYDEKTVHRESYSGSFERYWAPDSNVLVYFTKFSQPSYHVGP